MAASPDGRRRAIRLTFSYDQSGTHLIDRTAVSKPAGAGDDLAAPWPGEAIGAELRTADQRATFRRLLPAGALPPDSEVFDPAAPGGVRRDPAPLPSGVFTVVVPDDADAEEVVLVVGAAAVPRAAFAQREQAGQAAAGGGPVVFARFPFRDR